MEHAACPSATPRSCPTPRRKLLFAMPRRAGASHARTEKRRGRTKLTSTVPVQTIGETPGSVQPARSVAKAVGAERDRIRLSRIFHRPMNEIGFLLHRSVH